MKHILIILTIGLLLFSCEDNELSRLKKERDELNKEMSSINAKLKKINEKIEELEPTVKIPLVAAQTIKYQVFEHKIDLQANVETDKDVMVYPEFSGVMNLLVREGQTVGAGQVIATINDGGLTHQINQARIQADLARTAYQKQANLWAKKIGSEMQYLSAKTNYEAAQKSISALQSTLSKTAVRAPFSGVVDEVITQNGQVVGPGVPIVRLINNGNMKVEASVPEVYISTVRAGTPVDINIPNVGETVESKIQRVGNYINPNNRTFLAEIPVPNKGGLVKPNLMAKIQIIDYMNPNAITVPTNIIKEDDKGNYYVYILSNIKGNYGIAKKAVITRGQTSGNTTEVKNGLKAGDQIITEGANNVSEGNKVKF